MSKVTPTTLAEIIALIDKRQGEPVKLDLAGLEQQDLPAILEKYEGRPRIEALCEAFRWGYLEGMIELSDWNKEIAGALRMTAMAKTEMAELKRGQE